MPQDVSDQIFLNPVSTGAPKIMFEGKDKDVGENKSTSRLIGQ